MPTVNLDLEKPIRTAQVKTEFFSTNGPRMFLAYADDIDAIGNNITVIKVIEKPTR